jgi:hypothetical protein
MSSDRLAPLIVLAMFTILVIWAFLPRVIFSFFPETLSAYFKNDDIFIKNQLDKDDVSSTINILESLGFIKLGVMITKPPLWGKKQRSLIFASEKERTFATVVHANYKTVCVFLTSFSGGQIVTTSNKDVFRSIRTQEGTQAKIYNVDISDLLAFHQKEVDKSRNKGFAPIKKFTQQTRIEAITSFYMIKRIRRGLLIWGSLYLFFIIGFCFILGYFILKLNF